MTRKFSKILLPHDGSKASGKAEEESIKFAKATGSEIVLLYVVDERYAPPSALLSFIDDTTSLKAARKELGRVLKAGAETMLDKTISRFKHNGIRAKMAIRAGSPDKEIVKAAKELGCDLVIMGSASLKSGKLKALGSVARKVSESASCPVMLVH